MGTKDLIKNTMLGIPMRWTLGSSWDRESQLERVATQLVANKFCGVDVDRFDYLARDSRISRGLPSFDCNRIMRFSRIINGRLSFSWKEREEVYGLFQTRFAMFGKVKPAMFEFLS